MTFMTDTLKNALNDYGDNPYLLESGFSLD